MFTLSMCSRASRSDVETKVGCLRNNCAPKVHGQCGNVNVLDSEYSNDKERGCCKLIRYDTIISKQFVLIVPTNHMHLTWTTQREILVLAKLDRVLISGYGNNFSLAVAIIIEKPTQPNILISCGRFTKLQSLTTQITREFGTGKLTTLDVLSRIFGVSSLEQHNTYERILCPTQWMGLLSW